MEKYVIDVIKRGFDQSNDDYHATVTRVSDNKKIIIISGWRWVVRFRTRRRGLDHTFKYHDKREKRLARKDRYNR